MATNLTMTHAPMIVKTLAVAMGLLLHDLSKNNAMMPTTIQMMTAPIHASLLDEWMASFIPRATVKRNVMMEINKILMTVPMLVKDLFAETM